MKASCTVNTSATATEPNSATPWPMLKHRLAPDADVEARVEALLATMSLAQKVGQMTQAEISSVTLEEIEQYHIGSVLNGGDAFVNGDKYASVDDWVDYMDSIYDASMSTQNGRLPIPITYGIDAVHGNSKFGFATLFPHNIGLGATRNPELIRQIGEVTAKEVLATGIDWTFAPTLAVVRDDRWGRTYESYSEDPRLVGELGEALVEGIQGTAGTDSFLGDNHVYATAKHWVGDGGTDDGVDQGDNTMSEADLVRLQASAYFPTIEAGVQSIMVSHSQWHGHRMHGHQYLLTEILKGQLGFDGFVISDWNAHGRVPGCTNANCPDAINAGLDMFMVTEEYTAFIANTMAQVESGEIPMARIDDAVRRILRVKIRSGLFDKGRPSDRVHARKRELVGSAEHRAIARQAARESLVLLKNNHGILPLKPSQHIVVAGDAAHNLAKQTGAWTMTWQGTGNSNEDFTGATSIYDGLATAVNSAGGSIELAEDGHFAKKPDVAVVVFGEDPYAEWQGDVSHIVYSAQDDSDRALLAHFKAQGIPVVAVFISGRPLWVNRELNLSDAFVAAWLPGSEGGAIADVILAKANGEVNYDFKGKLSFSWPKRPSQTQLNIGDSDYDPLFGFGYGLRYTDSSTLAPLDETLDVTIEAADDDFSLLRKGLTVPWQWTVFSDGQVHYLNGSRYEDNRVKLSDADRWVQGDSVEFRWKQATTAYTALGICSPWHHENTQAFVSGDIVMDVRVIEPPQGPVKLAIGGASAGMGEIDITAYLQGFTGSDWHTVRIPLQAFAEQAVAFDQNNQPLVIKTQSPLCLRLNNIHYSLGGDAVSCA